ncbi:MAG: type 1 glutamine amidotransferase [Patescibacteria group bacterium]
MNTLVIEHAKGRAEGLDLVAQSNGFDCYVWKAYEEANFLLNPDDFDSLIVAGGPMGSYEMDKYPFFRMEKKLIEYYISEDIPVLGICLGAQIIASLLGGKVEKTFLRKGFKYVSQQVKVVSPDPLLNNIEGSFVTFQFHRDEITIPPKELEILLSSDDCSIEGYRVSGKNIWGVQFHPEIGLEKAKEILSLTASDNEDTNSLLELAKNPSIKENTKLLQNFFKEVKSVI